MNLCEREARNQFLNGNTERENQVDITYLDYIKVFDRVDHKILATKHASISMSFTFYKTIIMNIVIKR